MQYLIAIALVLSSCVTRAVYERDMEAMCDFDRDGYYIMACEDLFEGPYDCKDGDMDVHPGAVEQCDDIDNDCDDIVDEGCQ